MGIERIESNSRANRIAQALGFKCAETFKADYVNKNHVSKFDFGYDTNTGYVVILNKQGEVIETTDYKKPAGL